MPFLLNITQYRTKDFQHIQINIIWIISIGGIDAIQIDTYYKTNNLGATDSSWGDVKTIKYGKISTISNDVSEKHSIVYTYACIESSIIEQYYSDKNLNDHCSSHN